MRRSAAGGSTRNVLIVAFIMALAVRTAAAWLSGPVGPQEIRYLTIARSIVSGQGFEGLDHRFPDVIQPPLYPLIVAAVILLPGPDVALARGASILLGALTVLPISVLTRRLFGERAARRAAFLAAFHPLLVLFSSAILTESAFALIIAMVAAVVVVGIDKTSGSRSGGQCLLLGLLLGLSFLVRPEGLTYAAAACAVLVIEQVRQNGVRSAHKALPAIAWLGVGFAVLVLPYFVWVHGETGRWLLAPKATLFQVYEKLREEGRQEGWEEPAGSELLYERTRFGLNSDRTAIRADEEFAAVTAAVGGGLLMNEQGGVWLSRPADLASVFLRNLMDLYLDLIKNGLLAPLPLLMLAGVGITSKPWNGRFGRAAFVVLAFLFGGLPVFLAPLNPRFLYSAVVLILPWVARGWQVAELRLIASVDGEQLPQHPRLPVRRWLARVAVSAVVIGAMMAHLIPAVRGAGSRYAGHKEMGLWIQRNTGEGRIVMAETPVVSYYANAAFEVLPYAALADVLHYGKHRHAEYLVADTEGIRRNRPQLTGLLNRWRRHPGLELVHSVQHGRARAIHLYRITDGPDE